MKKIIAIIVLGMGVALAPTPSADAAVPGYVMTRAEYNKVRVGDSLADVKRKVGSKGRYERTYYWAEVPNWDWVWTPPTEWPLFLKAQERSFSAGKGRQAVKYPMYPNRVCRAYRLTFVKSLDGKWRVGEKHNWSNTC